MRSLFAFHSFHAPVFSVIALIWFWTGWAQIAKGQSPVIAAPRPAAQPALDRPTSSESSAGSPEEASAADVRPPALADAKIANQRDRPWDAAPAGASHQQPFSRVGVGVGVSPLGIGANATIVLTDFFDGRLSGNYFAYNNGRIEADGFNVYGGLHLASAQASLDVYPFRSPVRLSAGLMFYNTNHVSATMRIAPGTGFSLNGDSYFAGGAGAAPTPLTGVAAVAFHSVRPAPTLTFGIGKFIPRSNRHWSFPAEYGVAFTGAPSISIGLAGMVCTDAKLTMCGDASSSSNPVGAAFNSDLQAKIASWHRSLNRVRIFPILSGGVVYSFNTPWQGTPKAKF